MIFSLVLVAGGMALIAANGTPVGTCAGGILMAIGIAAIVITQTTGVTP